jgi:type IV pilus assembly protein PilE
MMKQYVHPLPVRAMHYMRGITLIELMIVVVIIGFMAVIAYPNYREFAARAKRTEAKANLLRIATNQERFYLQNNTFTCDLTQLGFPVAAGHITDSGSYQVDVTACTAANFTAVAAYQMGGVEATKCGSFQIDGRGTRISGPDTDCWTRTRK